MESVAATLAIGLSVDFTLHYGVAYSASAIASRSHQGHLQGDAVAQAVTQMCGPVTMAALTTLLPGNFSSFLHNFRETYSILIYSTLSRLLCFYGLKRTIKGNGSVILLKLSFLLSWLKYNLYIFLAK